MNKLLEQLGKHSKKQFVPPPADVSNATGTGSGGTFDVSMVMNDGQWALPMLKGIITPEKINVDFINEILTQLGQEGIDVSEELDPSLMSNVLRVALNHLVNDLDDPDEENVGTQKLSSLPTTKVSATLGSKSSTSKLGGGAMEDILQHQADGIASQIESVMDEILDERPDLIAIIPDQNQVVIDPAVLEFTRLVTETTHELMWDLGRPGNITDLTLLTRVEDVTELLGDVLSSLPEGGEEE
jgi:hypothetical protein